MTVKQTIRQWPMNSKRGMVFSVGSASMAVHATIGYINRGMVLSVWSLTGWYKQDSWSIAWDSWCSSGEPRLEFRRWGVELGNELGVWPWFEGVWVSEWLGVRSELENLLLSHIHCHGRWYWTVDNFYTKLPSKLYVVNSRRSVQ
jgi:hypothetical protein